MPNRSWDILATLLIEKSYSLPLAAKSAAHAPQAITCSLPAPASAIPLTSTGA
jgi:hypothetical protein